MSTEDYSFTESGNLTHLIRTTTVDNHHLPGAPTSQGNRDRKIPSKPTEDEHRLLGYLRKREGGVPIKPISNRSKPPDFSIKPQNSLSSNRRPTTTGTSLGINRPQLRTTSAHTNSYKRGLEQIPDIEEGRSLQKRSRTEKSQPKSQDIIEIEDSDDHSHVGRTPFTYRETYGRRFGDDPAPASYYGGVPEFRAVDQTVAPRTRNAYKKSENRDPEPGFDEEVFMHDARKERHKITSEGTKPRQGPALMKSVEIRSSNTGKKETTLGKSGQSGQDKDAATPRDSSAHESPDELQGEKTIGKPVRRSPRSTIAPRSDTSPERGNMPPSQISPGSFTKSRKETRSKSLRKGPKASANKAEREFNLKFARFQNQRYDETTNPDGGVLAIGESDILIGPKNREAVRWKHEIAMRQIVTMIYGANTSGKVRLRLRKTANTETSSDLYLEFTSEKEKSDFVLVFQNQRNAAGISFREKDSHWMDRAFLKSENETADRQVTGFKRSSPENKANMKEAGTKPETRKRAKLHESLQDEGGNTKGNIQKHDGNKLCGQRGLLDADDYGRKSQLERPGGGLKTRRNDGSDIPGRCKLHESSPSPFFGSRETRSKARKQTTTTISGDEKQASPSRVNEPIPKWSKPLVYPPIGKRKAEVEAHDLERLRDHEFLNDNLVGLYLRFLEHHLERANPDLANRIYVFNSYFFASLTNTPRGTKGINYDAVSKWTRLVDIFSRDYVVVPINENAHWYVAIICNLPQLQRQLESDELETPASENEKHDTSADAGGDDVSSIPKIEPITEPDGLGKKEDSKKDTPCSDGDEQHTRKDLASLTLSDQKEEVPLAKDADSEKEDWPEEDENPTSPASNVASKPKPESEEDKVKPPENPLPSSPPVEKATSTQSKKPPRKSTGPPIRKYDEKQPIIITFDSLGCSRSPTITILRNYLEEEAKAKRSMKINKPDILGMTAKAIPEQPNYSDCGLYLLAYLEKFAQDPDQFIRKLLKREMNKKDDWPKMESRVLRKHLREFLINLHDEQDDTDQKKGSEKSSMVDAQPLEILLKPREKSTKDTPGDSTIASSARGSPFAPEKNQFKTTQHTLASPSPTMHITDTLHEKLSSLGNKAEDSVEEIPCTPSEPSQPISSTEVHEATEPQVPGTPDAHISGKDGPATPPHHNKIIEGTPSPHRISPRNQNKESSSRSAKVSNEHESEQSKSRKFMDEIYSGL